MATKCALTDLPTELLVEIASYHESSFTFLSPLTREEHIGERRVQREVLRSLSQTCLSLRQIFLPKSWEHLEVSKPNLQEACADSALTSVIFPFIKSIHLSMRSWTRSDMKAIFFLLEFIRTLPNLTGLQIYYGVSFDVVSILSYAFAGNTSFPAIVALAVQDNLDGILGCFPNLKTLSGASFSENSPLLRAAKTRTPYLEAIAGLRPRRYQAISERDRSLEDIGRDFPSLKALSISTRVHLETADDFFVRLKRVFGHLSDLGFVFYPDRTELLPLEELAARGRDVLRNSSSSDPKILRIWSYDSSVGPQILHMEKV
ncbi:hypothetical protein R3P38DRAFT_2881527 [Favolaschia claudopus]|uniref:F-box domain-containing protein n=1 Tax=Favolaschia claudopus TaxID=2862362 RepID=A0AAW0D2M0_9AGAR